MSLEKALVTWSHATVVWWVFGIVPKVHWSADLLFILTQNSIGSNVEYLSSIATFLMAAHGPIFFVLKEIFWADDL